MFPEMGTANQDHVMEMQKNVYDMHQRTGRNPFEFPGDVQYHVVMTNIAMERSTML